MFFQVWCVVALAANFFARTGRRRSFRSNVAPAHSEREPRRLQIVSASRIITVSFYLQRRVRERSREGHRVHAVLRR